jgi:hypothetical protein
MQLQIKWQMRADSIGPVKQPYNKIATIFGHISRTDRAKSWIPMKGRKPLNISVKLIWGGATDLR